MTVRAKFICTAKLVRPATQEGFDEEAELHLAGVCGQFDSKGNSDIEENRIFGKWTPSASLTMVVRNKAAYDQLEEGNEYYIDIAAAE